LPALLAVSNATKFISASMLAAPQEVCFSRIVHRVIHGLMTRRVPQFFDFGHYDAAQPDSGFV
jgi:hypothetical protein